MVALTRACIVIVLSCLAAACAGPPRVTLAPDARTFDLVTFFTGRTVGEGAFRSGIAGIDRPFKVFTRGTWNGRTLTLVEDFEFADGERDRKTWRFTRVSPGRYTGTREDVIGTADVFQEGKTVRLNYSADVRGKDGRTTRLDFADVIAYLDDRRVLNRATVSLAGLPIGEVDLAFVKR